MQSKKNIVAIIQARNGSTRLKNKIMKEVVHGKSLIDIVVKRAIKTSLVDFIVVATTTNSEDDCLAQWCNDKDIKVFRGSETNVLDRYYKCAVKYNADTIVRITADDPFKDPQVNDYAIKLLIDNKYDYVSNTINPSYPEGLDVEVFTFVALKSAYENATLESEKEHVTPYIWKNKDKRGWWEPISSEKHSIIGTDPLMNQIDHFVSVINGSNKPLVTANEGLRNLKVLEGIYKSAEMNQTFKIT